MIAHAGTDRFHLAGGKSTRMGVDKAFVELDGRTLLARALELARGLASDVRIVGDVAKFGKLGPVVEDIFQNSGLWAESTQLCGLQRPT